MFLSQIIGNIGNDATRENANGSEYLRFSVAVNDRRGETQQTTWVSVFTRQLSLLPYLKKGTKVFINGKPSFKVFYSQNLNSHQTGISLNANTIELLGSKREEEDSVQEPVAEKPAKAPF